MKISELLPTWIDSILPKFVKETKLKKPNNLIFFNFDHCYYLVSINHTHVNNESKYKCVQVYYSSYSSPPPLQCASCL